MDLWYSCIRRYGCSGSGYFWIRKGNNIIKHILILFAFTLGLSQSYSLQDAVDIALENKEALKASAMDLAYSRQGVKGSYSGILPSLRFSGGMNEARFPSQVGGYNTETGELTLDKINRWSNASNTKFR
jgi:outer membrane protein TolC